MITMRGRQRGFSLLELILVLVIIGIVLSAITLSITNRRLDNLQLEAQRLQALISMATDQAVISNQEYGLSIDDSEYQFLIYDQGNDEAKWVPVDDQSMRQFQTRKFPEGVSVRIQVAGLYGNSSDDELDNGTLSPVQDEEDDESKEKPLLPQILMLSSAEVTPFVIRLGYDDEDPAFFELRTEVNGNLTLSRTIYEPMDIGWSDIWRD